MRIRRIEALALAICKFSGGFDPEDKAFRLCNPGRLRVFSNRTFPGEWDEGLRSFKTWKDGLAALVFDLETKCSGKSRTHMDPETSLKNLLNMWGISVPRKAITFLRRALEEPAIEASTAVGWFLEDRVIGPSGHRAIEEQREDAGMRIY